MKQGAPEPIAALNRVRILESGEPLVDIRDFCPAVRTVEKAVPFLRRTVAEMLNRAASMLPAGHRFAVGTALRTLATQRGYWEGYFAKMKEAHPDWPLSALRRATNRYFAPYDQPAPPGHCTGGAVDVVLEGPNGEPLDVTSPTKDWEGAYTWSDRISHEARHNRMVLVDAMLGAGFSNCRDEYWHYSDGDSAWAVRVGEANCPYGFVEPPVVVEARFEGGSASDVHREGDGTWVVHPALMSDGPQLLIGLFYSQDKPLSIRIDPPLPDSLYLSADRETWEQVNATRQGEVRVLSLTPTAERLYLSFGIPAKPEAEPGAAGRESEQTAS